MSASEFCLITLPEWYRTERETEKTIDKLGSVKELDYYLKNPDEYIRRLAILRLHKLTDKDSLYILKDLIDDPVESDENKYIAAWVLKSLSKKWISDIFSSNGYLGKFSGNESFEELFSINQEHASPSVDFDFASSLSYSSLKLDSDESALERDIYFETEFDLKQWFSTFGSRLLKASVKILRAVPVFIIKLPVLLGRTIYTLFRKLLDTYKKSKENKSESIQNMHGSRRIKPIRPIRPIKPIAQNNTYNDYYSLRKELYKKPGMFSFIKKGLFQMLYILFFPLRFVLKHKLAIFCVLLLTYSLLAFTDYGRAFTNKYMAIDLKEIQNNTFQMVKDYSVYALNEFNRISGINDWKQKENAGQSNSPDTLLASDAADPVAANYKLYTVTAKSGLNIRKSPDSVSDKVGNNLLTFGSTVTYLSMTQKDTSGRAWYYVEAMDGRIGWVSAIYLKEKKDG